MGRAVDAAAVAMWVGVIMLGIFPGAAYRAGYERGARDAITTPPNTLIAVDAEHWQATADAIARAYGEACNRALALHYGGDYGDTSGYTCTPVHDVVYLGRDGRPQGDPVEVKLPWGGLR